jgi:hypothetical protein
MTDINVRGTNQPEDAAMYRIRLPVQYRELQQRRDELLAAGTAVPTVLNDDETSGRLSDFVRRQLDTFLHKVEATRETEKRPWLERGDAVQRFFVDELAAPVTELKRELIDRQTAYLKSKDEQRVRGDYSTMSLATRWIFVPFDRTALSAADWLALKSNFTQAATEAAVRAYIAAGGRDLDGVNIIEDKRAR